MTDPNRPSSPHDSCPSVESTEPAVSKRAVPLPASRSGDTDELSYDQRAAAAIEAVRQLEAHFAGRSIS
jgi:hypothetical protein